MNANQNNINLFHTSNEVSFNIENNLLFPQANNIKNINFSPIILQTILSICLQTLGIVATSLIGDFFTQLEPIVEVVM